MHVLQPTILGKVMQEIDPWITSNKNVATSNQLLTVWGAVGGRQIDSPLSTKSGKMN